MNKLLRDLAGDLAVCFGGSLAFFGIAGAFVGVRSLITVFSIAAAGILITVFGLRTRKLHDSACAKVLALSRHKQMILDGRMSDSFG